MTLELVKRIRTTAHGINYSIVVIDNGSDERQWEILKNKFKNENTWILLDEEKFESIISYNDKVDTNFLIRLKTNYGYAKGNNYGLKLVYQLGFDYCIIANNDVIFDMKIVPELINYFFRHKKLALLGPKVIGPNGKTQGPIPRPTLIGILAYNIFFPFYWFFYRSYEAFRKRFYDPSKLKRVFSIVGCFMICDVKKLQKVGFFDENTFLYHEEVILAEKLIKKGYYTGYVEKYSVKHMHAQSSSLKKKSELRKYSIASQNYYLSTYRGYSRLGLKMVEYSRMIIDYVWLPLVGFIKKLKKLPNK